MPRLTKDERESLKLIAAGARTLKGHDFAVSKLADRLDDDALAADAEIAVLKELLREVRPALGAYAQAEATAGYDKHADELDARCVRIDAALARTP